MTARPKLLFLTQRIPYPPFKGEKIRSLQILRFLARHYEVHLGCLADDPADLVHRAALEPFCASLHLAPLDRRRARLWCLRGLITGEPLSVAYFRDPGLQRWVAETLRRIEPDVLFVSSSNMAPYILDWPRRTELRIVDLVDLDSEKWRAYAKRARPPMRWIYGREWRLMAELDRRIAAACDWSVFVSREEAALLATIAPMQQARIRAIGNGVDHAYFDPSIDFAALYPTDRANFVFTGTMDYPPNVDAVNWFGIEVLPQIRRALPDAHFWVVGANPAPALRALQKRDGITVTGRVPDVRPYLAHATAAVAPMRIARGIQNKVLEAMAMARPVVATPQALEGIGAIPGEELIVAAEADRFAAAAIALARGEGITLGAAARRRVLADYGWEGRLRAFVPLLRLESEAAG